MESKDLQRVQLVFHPVPKSPEPLPQLLQALPRSGTVHRLPGAVVAASALQFEPFREV
jgi:hypothetical protein